MMGRFDKSGTEARLLDQYRESANLKGFLKALIDAPSKDLRVALEQLRGRLDIDAMAGVQLDRIGDIIGIKRPFVLDFAEGGTAFETTDAVGVSNPVRAFSSLQAPDQGGRLVNLGTNALMADPDYRVLLKATIFRNTTTATVEDLERYGAAVLGLPVRIVNGHTQISVQIAGRVSPVLRGIIRSTMQAAAGIRIDSFTFGVTADAFTFDGPGGTGFGSLSTPETGSGFSRLLQRA